MAKRFEIFTEKDQTKYYGLRLTNGNMKDSVNNDMSRATKSQENNGARFACFLPKTDAKRVS